MNEEIGVVVYVDSNRARVNIEPSERCNGCGMCADEGSSKIMYINNNADYKIGDRLKITIATAEILKAGFLLYIVPLLDFFLGYFIGTLLLPYFPITNLPEIMAVVFLVGSLGILHLVDRYYKRKGKSVVSIEKINPKAETI